MTHLLKDERRLFIDDLPMARHQQHMARLEFKTNPCNPTVIGKLCAADRFVQTILGSSHRYV